jgi:hypothetical protein
MSYNNFIIEIINKHKYFTDTEYNSIKNINNNCKIDKDNDCQTNIKNMTSINNKTNRTQL